MLRVKPGGYNTASLMEACPDFLRPMGRRRFILVWDGLSAHRSVAMRAFLSRWKRCVRVARLPSYAPGLNPVELVWRNVKGVELGRVFCVETVSVRRTGTRALHGFE